MPESESVQVFGFDVTKASLQGVHNGAGFHHDLLAIAIQDLQEQQLRNMGGSESRPNVLVFTTQVTSLIKSGPIVKGAHMLPPDSHVSQQLWVPDTNIFDLDLLILPFAFPRPSAKKETSYLAIVVDMMSGLITVLNPRKETRLDNIMVTVSDTITFIHRTVILHDVTEIAR